MLILGFETSAKAASVALSRDGKLLGECYQNTGLTHSQTLLPMAEGLLKTCDLTASQVKAVAVAAGPGSFTGIRIGVAAAKGFAFGARIPCYGVSTLEAMALNTGLRDGYILCTMDARRSQTYTALFCAAEGKLRRVTPDRAISFEELGEELRPLREPVYLVGDGSLLCYQTLSGSGLILPPEHRMHQRAAGVCLAAEQAILRGDSGDAAALRPRYLRLSQAERERNEKLERGELL